MIEAEPSHLLPEHIPNHSPEAIPISLQQFPPYTLDAISAETDTIGDAVFKLELLQDSLNLSSSQKENLTDLILELKTFPNDSNLKDIFGQLQSDFFSADPNLPRL